MKKLFYVILFIFSLTGAYSQNAAKHDVVVKSSGDILTGDVVEITDSTIRFTYTGEKLVYTIKKSDILKITYASGRSESFGAPAPASQSSPAAPAQPLLPSSGEDTHNKIAILPFGYIKDGQPMAEEVSESVQNQCYDLLSKHAGMYTVVSPRAINVKLSKAGINRSNVLNYTMADLCNLLGVEYIIDGVITQRRTTQTSYGNSTYTTKKKDDDKKETGYGSNYSTTTQNYETVMDLKIYNEKAQIVYNQNRKAFWNTEDAYKNTLEYLIKRSPLYTK